MFSLQSNGTQNFESLSLVREILADFASVIPNLMKAILVIILGWIIAKIVAGTIRKILKKIQIDKFGEKLEEIEFISKSSVKISLSAFISKFLYYAILLVFWMVAIEILNVEALTQMMKDVIDFIPSLISAMLILVLGVLFSEFIRKMLETTMKSLGIPSASMVSKAIFYFLLINIFIVAISQAGFNVDFISSNITVLIGGIALAFAIAYGLASRSIAANTLSAFYSKDEYELGDTISVDGVTGKIIDISNRTIILASKDGKVIIPFSKLMENSVTVHEE